VSITLLLSYQAIMRIQRHLLHIIHWHLLLLTPPPSSYSYLHIGRSIRRRRRRRRKKRRSRKEAAEEERRRWMRQRTQFSGNFDGLMGRFIN